MGRKGGKKNPAEGKRGKGAQIPITQLWARHLGLPTQEGWRERGEGDRHLGRAVQLQYNCFTSQTAGLTPRFSLSFRGEMSHSGHLISVPEVRKNPPCPLDFSQETEIHLQSFNGHKANIDVSKKWWCVRYFTCILPLFHTCKPALLTQISQLSNIIKLRTVNPNLLWL